MVRPGRPRSCSEVREHCLAAFSSSSSFSSRSPDCELPGAGNPAGSAVHCTGRGRALPTHPRLRRVQEPPPRPGCRGQGEVSYAEQSPAKAARTLSNQTLLVRKEQKSENILYHPPWLLSGCLGPTLSNGGEREGRASMNKIYEKSLALGASSVKGRALHHVVLKLLPQFSFSSCFLGHAGVRCPPNRTPDRRGPEVHSS